MSRLRSRQLGWGVVGAAFLLLLPRFLPEIRVHLATEVLIFGLFAVSFNVMFGYAGLLPFGQAALFGVGAYGTALIINHLPGIPLFLVLAIASLLGIGAAVLIGFFCVRLSGPYFALSTLAFQMFLYAVALNWRAVTNGDDGMGVTRPDLHLPVVGSIPLRSVDNMYYLTLIVAVIAIVACYLFLKTPLGNSVACVREKEIRASFLGYNTFLIKLTAFSASGVLAGLAGGLFVLYQEFVATTAFDMNTSMTPVLMTIIGGSSNFFGPVLGAAVYLILQDWISSQTSYWMLLMGCVFILVVLYFEGGLIGLFKLDWIRHGRQRERQ